MPALDIPYPGYFDYDDDPHDYSRGYSSWIFTINNYTDDDIENLKRCIDRTTTLYAAKEIAPTTGTPHIQGFLTLRNSMRRAGVSKLLNKKPYLKAGRGGKKYNYDYIIKGLQTNGEPKEFSEVVINHDCGDAGTRNDIRDAVELAIRHGIKRAATELPATFAKYSKGIERTVQIQRSPDPRAEPPRVYWLFGPKGIGKTRFSYDREEDPRKVFIGDMWPQWFDGVMDHNWFIIDELDKRDFRVWQLLRILDRYPFTAPVKGSTIEFNVPNIVITSTAHPNGVIPDPSDWSQVERRITYIGTKDNLDDPWEWLKQPELDDQDDGEDLPDYNPVLM